MGLSLADVCGELERYGVRLNTSQLSKLERAERPTNVAEVVALKHALKFHSYDQLLGMAGWTDDEVSLMVDEWLFAQLHRRTQVAESELNAARQAMSQVSDRLWAKRERVEPQEGGHGHGEHPEAP